MVSTFFVPFYLQYGCAHGQGGVDGVYRVVCSGLVGTGNANERRFHALIQLRYSAETQLPLHYCEVAAGPRFQVKNCNALCLLVQSYCHF